VIAVVDNVDQEVEEPTEFMCQQALAECRHDLTAAFGYLRANFRKLLGQQKSWNLQGLYENKEAGDIQVNVQTQEVYFGDRMLIPIPFDLGKSENFLKIFGVASMDRHFCAVREARKHRTVLEVEKEDVGYRIEMWNSIYRVLQDLAVEKEDVFEKSRKEKKPGDDSNVDPQSEEEYLKTQNLYVNRPAVNEGATRAHYLGDVFVPYEEGSCGWLSELFDPLFRDEMTFGLFKGLVTSWKVISLFSLHPSTRCLTSLGLR
jgi:hypothetical protein